MCVCTVCFVGYAGGMYVGMLSCQSSPLGIMYGYSVASLSKMLAPSVVLCRVDVEASVCVASGIRRSAAVQR